MTSFEEWAQSEGFDADPSYESHGWEIKEAMRTGWEAAVTKLAQDNLTKRDRKAYQAGHNAGVAHHKKATQGAIARAIEAATIDKLAAGVSVEPAYLMSPDGKCYAPSKPPLSAGNAKATLLTLYTATAIAAARVQALEEAAKVCDRQAIPNAGFLAEKVRALINTNLTTGEMK